jgi:hypothetical protein
LRRAQNPDPSKGQASARLLRNLLETALQAAEKFDSKRLLVAQALLPVRVVLRLSLLHSQEWLCYSTFSASCLAAEAGFGCGSAALHCEEIGPWGISSFSIYPPRASSMLVGGRRLPFPPASLASSVQFPDFLP